jgi:hypothetical protein
MIFKALAVILVPAVIAGGIRFLCFGQELARADVNIIVFAFVITFVCTYVYIFPSSEN